MYIILAKNSYGQMFTTIVVKINIKIKFAALALFSPSIENGEVEELAKGSFIRALLCTVLTDSNFLNNST